MAAHLRVQLLPGWFRSFVHQEDQKSLLNDVKMPMFQLVAVFECEPMIWICGIGLLHDGTSITGVSITGISITGVSPNDVVSKLNEP
jgi:hypothetical protein